MVLFEVIKEIVTFGFYGILLWLVMAVCYYSVKELFKQESAKKNELGNSQVYNDRVKRGMTVKQALGLEN